MSASSDFSDPQTTPPPLARHAVLQSDQFCPCGYNLFGQAVARDERLGFEVVRCPECGRFSPAGHGTPSSRPWLRRLSALMLAAWVAALLAVFVVAGLSLWGLLAAGGEAFLTTRYVAAGTDRPLNQEYDPQNGLTWTDAQTGETVPAGAGQMVRVPYDDPIAKNSSAAFYGSGDDGPPRWLWPVLLSLDGLIGLALGTLVAAGMWHARWPRWGLLLLLAVPATLALLPLSAAGPGYRLIHGWYAARVLVGIGIAFAAMALGIGFGRHLARGLARLLIPPRPRQAVAFLWHADGRPLPISS